MITLKSIYEDKKLFNKEEALVRMILGIPMKMEKGKQYYCYGGGSFYVSDRYDFKEAREWNPNDASGIPDWVNI